MDEETDEIAALVIRKGRLFHHDVVLPIDYVIEIIDGVFRVRINEDKLRQIEPFRPPAS